MSEVKLYHGDCLVEMNKIADKSIDMILTDPPYGTTACKWDSVIPFDKMWEQLNRIIKDNGAIVLFGSEPFSSLLRCSNLKMFRYDWIWHKNSSGGFVSANKMPMKYHEIISVFYKNLPTYNPQFQAYSKGMQKRFKEGEMMNRKKQMIKASNSIQGGVSFEGKTAVSFKRGKFPESVLKFDSVPTCNNLRLHPTQKPTPLLEYLIKTYTLENETVLDNCMGSGSTGVACISTNRNFIGIELDDNYFKIAEERINKAKESIFDM